uniref:SHSP domain-containing protein n=1 Tax=Populus trichocarpa TaxID=3694 RepID=A0A2K1XZY4_POPTR
MSFGRQKNILLSNCCHCNNFFLAVSLLRELTDTHNLLMFPAHLHPHSVMENGDKFVSSIIFINNPDTFHIDLKDIERLKRLTGLENLFLDRDAATSIRSYADGTLYDVIVHEAGHGIELPPTSTRFSRKRAKPADRIPRSRHHHVGQVVGLVDIGECDDAYYFRVSLPGVRKDPNEFSYKIEADGKVLIKGVTITGERTVYKFSQKFEMLSRNLCPPGQFSISFQLPGPVDPRQLTSNFGDDGILDALIMKKRSA